MPYQLEEELEWVAATVHRHLMSGVEVPVRAVVVAADVVVVAAVLRSAVQMTIVVVVTNIAPLRAKSVWKFPALGHKTSIIRVSQICHQIPRTINA